jgi:hypothetical protein
VQAHPGKSDRRAEFAGHWLNSRVVSGDFSILASAQIEDTAAVVVREGREVVIVSAHRADGLWTLDQLGASYPILDGSFAHSGAFGPDSSEGWFAYVFGRLAAEDRAASLINGDRVERLRPGPDGFFFELRPMEGRGFSALVVEMIDSEGQRRRML